MTDPSFQPVLYVKPGCPFCLKVRLFALEAGILDRIAVRDFTPGSAAELTIREELGAALGKVSFPTALLAPGRYVAESDVIIAEFAAISGRDPDELPVYRTYAAEVLPSLVTLHRENQALKAAS
jgi:glutathione S-transferase